MPWCWDNIEHGEEKNEKKKKRKVGETITQSNNAMTYSYKLNIGSIDIITISNWKSAEVY